MTERLDDVELMEDESRVGTWIDEQMSKGDPFGTSSLGGRGGGNGGGFGSAFGLLKRLFG